MVPGQFKTTKPYLWQIQALHEFLQRPCCYIFEAEVCSVSNEKSQTLASKMSAHSCWGFSWNTWKISLRLHKYGFVLLNRLWIAANTMFCNPKTANYWKRSNRVPLETSLQIHCYITIPTWFNSKSDSCSEKKESWFYLYWLGSYSPKKVKNANNIMTYSVLSFDTTQKCDDFWLPGAESFPTIYRMNDFATEFFSHYYTLSMFYLLAIQIWYQKTQSLIN